MKPTKLTSFVKTAWPLLVVLLALLVPFKLMSEQGRAQSRERILENLIRKEVPIKVDLKKEKTAAFKELKNSKWVGEFELAVTNTGDKPIYYIYIDLVTDVKLNDSPLVFSLQYGRSELGDLLTKATPSDQPIKPGDTYVFKIHPGQISAWEDSVSKGDHFDAVKIRVALQGLSFGDGTGFFGNTAYPRANSQPTGLSQDDLRFPIKGDGGGGEDAEKGFNEPAHLVPATFLSSSGGPLIHP
jgi:hypothetical protein